MRTPASVSIDTATAAALPGVVAVFTGADMAADKVGPMAPLWAIATSDGKPMAEPPRWALARDTVRHVGEAVAAVIAETRAQAEDAADLLAMSTMSRCRRRRRPRGDGEGRAATARGAPGNVCFRFARGDEAAVQKAFDGAAHVVQARSRQQPADRRCDRAARGAGRRRRRQADALLLDAGAASHPPHGHRAASACRRPRSG